MAVSHIFDLKPIPFLVSFACFLSLKSKEHLLCFSHEMYAFPLMQIVIDLQPQLSSKSLLLSDKVIKWILLHLTQVLSEPMQLLS